MRSRKAIAANLFVGYYNNFFRSTKWHQPNFFIFDFWVVKILKILNFFVALNSLRSFSSYQKFHLIKVYPSSDAELNLNLSSRRWLT